MHLSTHVLCIFIYTIGILVIPLQVYYSTNQGYIPVNLFPPPFPLSLPSSLPLPSIQESFPEFFDLQLHTDLFAATESSSLVNPKGMAAKYEIPYLGNLPMDPNMMKACEDGYSFLELYPDSLAAAAFTAILQKIIAATPDSV